MAKRKADWVDLYEIKTMDCSPEFKKSMLPVTGRGNVSAVRDYVWANSVLTSLQNAGVDITTLTTQDEAVKKLHPAHRFRLKAYSPCLAFRYDELKPAEQEKLFTDTDWMFTTKENGVRGWFIFFRGEAFLFSRNYSDVDASLLDYWGNTFQPLSFSSDEIFAVDVEVKFEPGDVPFDRLAELGIETDSRLEAISAMLQMHASSALKIQEDFKNEHGRDLITFRMIAPLFFKGRNFVNRTLGEGMQVYDEVIAYGKSKGLNLKAIERCGGNKEEKEVFLETILAEGGEGIVAHYKKGSYNTTENRNRKSYVKLKRSVRDSLDKLGIGDTIDGWISGFKLGTPGTANEGRVAAFEISTNLRYEDGRVRPHVIAYTPGLSHEVMNAATTHDIDGNPTLAPEFYNMVCEVNGQNISKVSKRLTHPRLIRFRNDKSVEECIYSIEFINSQID